MSNVPKSRRKISDLEFYKNAIRLRSGLTKWLLRDFGIKPTNRRVDSFNRKFKLSDEDASTLVSLLDKYGLGRYSFTPSGHICKRVVAKKVIRERRKLNAYRKLMDKGSITRREVSNAYQSWRGNIKEFDSYKTVRSMDKLYNQLFVEN